MSTTPYRLDAQARRVTNTTLRTYRDRIEPCLAWCESQGVTLLADVTLTLLRSYLVHLQDCKLSSFTVNGTARAIKAFFNFCTDYLLPKWIRFAKHFTRPVQRNSVEKLVPKTVDIIFANQTKT
jgi:site-specific recombinase XerD